MKADNKPSQFFGFIAQSIWKHPLKWFAGCLLVIALLISGLPRLEFVFDYTRFYTEKSEVTRFYRTFQEQFSGDPQSIWLMPETDHHSFHPRTLLQLQALTDTIKKIPGIEQVTALTNVELPIRDAFGYRTERLVIQNSISDFDSTRVMNLPFLRNQLVSQDGRYPALVIRFEEAYPQNSIYLQLLHIEDLLLDRFENAHLAGRYWGEVQYSSMLETETLHGVVGSILVLIIMLYILFRRIGSILLPALAISLGVFAFFGLKGWAGWPIDILGVLFAPLLLIVGLSDVVHLYAKIQWKLQLKLSLKEAVKEAWKETGYATFLTSLTTGIGFMSLLTTDILPIRNFGFEAGWGVVLMFAVCIVVIPVFLRLSKSKWLLPKNASNGQWNSLALKGYSLSKKVFWIPMGIAVIVVGALWGANRIQSGVKNYWQIDPATTLSKDLDFFDDQFGGARYLDIGIKRKDSGSISDPQNFQVVEELTNSMRNHPAIGSVLSASDLSAVLNMARMGGSSSGFLLPTSTTQIESDLDRIYSNDSLAYHSMISFNDKWLRISARLANVRTDSAVAIQEFIRSKLKEISKEHELKFTGNSVLMDTTNEMLVENMFQSLVLAFLVIAVLMGLLFRSLKMLLLSLFPNVLPLLIALGIIGYLNIPLGTSTALILTIGFVIAVDDTIHYLMKFRLKWLETGDVDFAVKETNAQVGRAMVLSSMVMLAAFTPQFFSTFLEQFYFAVVISGVIISALVSDLLFLPWLLLTFFRSRDPEKKSGT